MATWQGLNINTGQTELPKYNSEGVFEEIYIAAVTTALANGDTILGPVIQAGLFVTSVKAAPDALDSATSGLLAFSVGYINSGTFTSAGFITAAAGTTARAGGIVSNNVPASYGQTFTNNITVAASITAGAGTAVAGNFRLGIAVTASP